jgi:hypothetical protein
MGVLGGDVSFACVQREQPTHVRQST